MAKASENAAFFRAPLVYNAIKYAIGAFYIFVLYEEGWGSLMFIAIDTI